MKKLLALLLLSPLVSSQDSNIVECRADENNSIEQCLVKYEIDTVDDCLENAMTGTMSEEEIKLLQEDLSSHARLEDYSLYIGAGGIVIFIYSIFFYSVN